MLHSLAVSTPKVDLAHCEVPVLIERLRSETRQHHDAIERNPLMKRIFASDFAFDEYLHLLRLTRGIVVPLEDVLKQALPVEFHDRLVRRDRLAGDLSGICGQRDDRDSAWRVPAWLQTSSGALGALYVLEGSTLGGQVIVRHLHAHFGERVSGRTAYFAGHGAENGPRWRVFKDILGRAGWVGDEVVSAAQATFALMDRGLAYTEYAQVPQKLTEVA